MDVEIILALDVVRCKFPEMDFVKTGPRKQVSCVMEANEGGNLHDLVWMVDFIETKSESQCCKDCHDDGACPGSL